MSEPRIPPAGIVGRLGKFAVGALQWWLVYALASQAAAIVNAPPRAVGFWVVVLWAFWLVPLVFNLGLMREHAWGSRPLWWTLGALIAIALGNYGAVGSFWSPATGVATLAVSIAVHAYVGACHLLSSAVGFPGCELRALAYLTARMRGTASTFAICPGLWTPLDRWEMRLWRRRVP